MQIKKLHKYAMCCGSDPVRWSGVIGAQLLSSEHQPCVIAHVDGQLRISKFQWEKRDRFTPLRS